MDTGEKEFLKKMGVDKLIEVYGKTSTGKVAIDNLTSLALAARIRLLTIATLAVGADEHTKESLRLQDSTVKEEFRTLCSVILESINVSPSMIAFPAILDELCNRAAA